MNEIIGLTVGPFLYCENSSETRKVALWRMLIFAENRAELARAVHSELLQKSAIHGKISVKPWGKTKIYNSSLWFQTKKQAEAARSRLYSNPHLCLAAPIPLPEKRDLSRARRHLRAVGMFMTDQELVQAVQSGPRWVSDSPDLLNYLSKCLPEPRGNIRDTGAM